MNFKDKSYFYSKFITLKRSGRKSAAQTVAPKKDRIKGSTKNPVGSAASKTAASNIQLNEGALKVLKEKRDKFNEKNKSKSVGLPALKAVMRRGIGAYSTSYRPTITGGKPNSRQAWGYARVNKFLEKKAGKPVKKAYVQDDDLMEKGGQIKNMSFMKWITEYNKNNSDEILAFFSLPSEYINPNLLSENNIILDVFEKQKDNINAKKHFQKMLDKADELGVNIYLKPIPRVHKLKSEEHKRKITKDYLVDYYNNFGFVEGKDDFMVRKPKMEKGGITGDLHSLTNQLLAQKIEIFIKKVQPIKFYYIDEDSNSLIIGLDENYTTGMAEKLHKEATSSAEFFDADSINMEYNQNTGQAQYSIKLKKVAKFGKGGKMAEGGDILESIYTSGKEYEYGGKMLNQIALPDTYASYESLKPILKNQGYELNKINMDIPVGKLAKGMSLSEVAAIHNLTADDLKSELLIGIETEMEHTDTPEYARAIALDHLFENPKYYTKLKQMEGIDAHYSSITKKFAEGGTIDPVFSFKTPTGEPSRLNYLQQVLVRTQGFKNFFGDWESAAKNFLKDDKNNYEKHYQNVSKVIEYSTLEPRVVFHGTKTEDEFFRFDVTKEKGVGRPYGYFAHNKEYSENFTKGSQRGASNSQPFIYQCFVNVRNPFIATTSEYWQKNKDEDGWQNAITGTLVWDKYKSIEKNEQSKEIEESVNSQIGSYIKSIFSGDKKPFWRLMAGDIEKDFKYFLMAYGYDGVYYGEEFSSIFDPENPSEYTQAVTIFDSKQVKLADGRNLNFNPMLDDIRYEDGGITPESEPTPVMDKKSRIGLLISGEKSYEVGGTVLTDKGHTNDAKKGGYFHGRSHDDGGIKAVNVDTGQMIEVEGEEVIITKNAVNDEEKREFEGEMLTNRQILSKINQSGGGVAFEDGGEIKAHTCGCSGKKFKFGGEMYEDFQIIRFLNDPQKISTYKIKSAKQYVDTLLEKMK